MVANQQFGRSRRWLPTSLSGADGVAWLSEDEKLKLTHVEMGAYAHIFAYVEEFIAPQMASLALDQKIDHRDAFDALTNFASEEVKHMNLFREIRQMVDDSIGFPLELIGDQQQTAHFVLSKHVGAVLLLTSAIEWFTQYHYLSGFKDAGDLDPFTKRIFKFHWLEESQHAKMDHLEAVRVFGKMDDAERDAAIDDLIELVVAVDGLIQKQTDLDVRNFAKYAGRVLTDEENQTLHDSVLKAKRYTFIESGVTHPNFLALFGEVTTPAQQERVQTALTTVL